MNARLNAHGFLTCYLFGYFSSFYFSTHLHQRGELRDWTLMAFSLDWLLIWLDIPMFCFLDCFFFCLLLFFYLCIVYTFSLIGLLSLYH